MSTAALSLNLVTTIEGWNDLKPEWNGLLNRSRANHLFLTQEYLATWLEVYGSDWQLCTLTARDSSGALRGIAPFAIGPGHGSGRRRLRHLTLMGGECESTSEYGDFIIEPGLEADLGRAFCRAILAEDELKWDLLRLTYVPKDSAVLRAMSEVLPEQRRTAWSPREHGTWSAPLGSTWEEFEQTRLSANRRSQLRRSWKKLTAQHAVRMLEAGSDIGVGEALEHLIRLNQDRWSAGGGTSFHTERFAEFHRKLAPRLAERGWLSLLLLEVDGEPASARYDFTYAGVLSHFQSGWKSDQADASLGQIMVGQSIRHAISRGLHTVDFMAGDNAGKASWGSEGRRLADLESCNPRSLRGRAAWLARDVLSRVRAGRSPAAA